SSAVAVLPYHPDCFLSSTFYYFSLSSGIYFFNRPAAKLPARFPSLFSKYTPSIRPDRRHPAFEAFLSFLFSREFPPLALWPFHMQTHPSGTASGRGTISADYTGRS